MQSHSTMHPTGAQEVAKKQTASTVLADAVVEAYLIQSKRGCSILGILDGLPAVVILSECQSALSHGFLPLAAALLRGILHRHRVPGNSHSNLVQQPGGDPLITCCMCQVPVIGYLMPAVGRRLPPGDSLSNRGGARCSFWQNCCSMDLGALTSATDLTGLPADSATFPPINFLAA